tara:strand:- start:479 stop:3727 length:3249 start_codon:yes stop_codon:yes gene_type:complete
MSATIRQTPKKKMSANGKPTMTDPESTTTPPKTDAPPDCSFFSDDENDSPDDSLTEELEKWTPDRDLKVENFKTVEYSDIRAAKYLLSIKPDHFADIYREKATKKLQETAKRLKNGDIKEPSDLQVERQIKIDHKILKSLCVEIVKGGKHGVIRDYKFCAPKKFGRRFSNGIQNIWAGFRAALLKPCTTDIDMKNAHPTILQWVCYTNHISCEKLNYYINFRDKVLKDMKKQTGKSRDFCKEQFLISVNESRYTTKSDYQFLKEFDLEMKGIQKKLREIDQYKYLNNYINDSEENYNGIFINLIMCYWENRILEYAIAYFRDVEVDINTLMFDGLMVSVYETRQIDGIDIEGRFPLQKCCAEKHLRMLNAIVKKCIGIDMKWDVKPQDDSRVKVPDDFTIDSMLPLFDEIVEDFNQTNFKVAENYLTLNDDGSYAFRKKDVFKEYHWHRYVYGSGENGDPKEEMHFIDKWLNRYPDIIKVYYERAREYPPGGGERSICPPNSLNLWTPFDYERWLKETNPDGTSYEYNERYAQLFEDMVRGLCADNEEYFKWFMQWLYTCIFHPATKSGRVPFFISKQGIGKDTLVEILQFIFGYHRCVTESSPEQNVWGQFNTILQATYFIILTEVSAKNFYEGLGKAKHLITQYEYTLNAKNQAQVPKMSTFHRFMGITNIGSNGEVTPVPVSDDERRFVLFRSSERNKGNHSFWEELYAAKDGVKTKWNFIRSCFECIKKYEHAPMFSDSEIPQTEFQKQAVTRHPIQEFFIEKCRSKDLTGKKKYPSDVLWNEYKEYAEGANVSLGTMQKEQFQIKVTRFSIPGVGEPRQTKWGGKNIKCRELDFDQIKKWVEQIDPMFTPLEKQRLNKMMKKVFRAVYFIILKKKKDTSPPPPEPSTSTEPPKFIIKPKIKKPPIDLFAEKKQKEKETDERIRKIEINGFKSAGVLLYSDEGFWMGLERKLRKNKKVEEYWCDFGGKREGDETPFETALRECKQECGVDISNLRLEHDPVYHPDSHSKHAVFIIRCPPDLVPEKRENFTEIKKTKYYGDDAHPRLKFDKEYFIHKKLQELNLWNEPLYGECQIHNIE